MPIRSRTALIGAIACVALLALDWLAAFHIGPFRHADESMYSQFGTLQNHAALAWAADHLVARFDPGWYLGLVLVPLTLALVRRRLRVVLAIVAIVLGANVSTELLKHMPITPRPGSWPSGHSTAAMALVLTMVLAVPARLRPAAAALGAWLAIAVGCSVVALGMHYPSDVLGGFLVAAAWTLAAVAALVAAEEWRPTSRPAGRRVSIGAALGAPGAVLAGALLLGAVVLALRPHDVVSYADAHRAVVVGAAAITALSLALSTGVLLSVRR